MAYLTACFLKGLVKRFIGRFETEPLKLLQLRIHFKICGCHSHKSFK